MVDADADVVVAGAIGGGGSGVTTDEGEMGCEMRRWHNTTMSRSGALVAIPSFFLMIVLYIWGGVSFYIPSISRVL